MGIQVGGRKWREGRGSQPGFRVLRPGPEKWGAMDVRSAPPPRAPHIRHGRAFRARRRRASSPARTRPVSWRKRGPDDVRLWPLPRASQTDEKAGAAASRDDYGKPAKKQKKYGKLLGDQWAATHGDAWKKFLAEKLKRCECEHPRTSQSNRRKALKEDEDEGIQPGIPAECLLCFAPVDKVSGAGRSADLASAALPARS